MDKDLLNEAFDRYEKMKFLDRIGNLVLPRLTGDHDMDVESRKLDIMLKKRMLGMDSSQEYEDSINGNGRSFWAQMAPSFAIRGLDAISEPSLIPKYKVAHSIADMLPSNVSNITKAGSKYGAGISRGLRAALYL